jgi:acyl phosphate:glycerol-3-phosphate acyltransferase
MSTSSVWLILYLLGAFVAGSVPFGWIVARLKGIDLKQIGSGNIGATNAARALGKPIGVAVLLLDTGKAFLPTWLARRYGADLPDLGLAGAVPALVGFAAICGHVFSPWLAFKGGKGVASSLGVFLAVAPLSAAIAGVVWVVLYATFRISSVGSLVAALALVVSMIVRREPSGHLVVVIATFVLVLVRHVDNIKRLLERREGQV